MTVVLTGATGYVGPAVLERLLDAGLRVRALVRRPEAALPAAVERVTIDLAAPRGLDDALAGASAVVHCAAEQHAPERERHRRTNVEGTHALLAAAVRAGVRRFVHLSTIAVYPRREPGSVVMPEDGYDPLPALRDPYAWSKIAADAWAALYRRQASLDVVTLRPGIVYGRGRDFVARIHRRLGRGLVLVAGTPRMLLPLVHLRDLAEAVWRALRAPERIDTALNVVGPDAPTQAAWLARRAACGRERLRPVYAPVSLVAWGARRAAAPATGRPARLPAACYRLAWAVQEVRYDLRATERALGWVPEIGVDAGLTDEASAPTADG